MLSFRHTDAVLRTAAHIPALAAQIEPLPAVAEAVTLAVAHGHLLARAEVDKGEYAFFYPLPYEPTGDLDAALDALDEYAVRQQIPLTYLDLSAPQADRLAARYPLARRLPMEEEGCFVLQVCTELDTLDAIPTLRGARVTLRAPDTADSAAFGRMIRDEAAMRYIGYNVTQDLPEATDEALVEATLCEFDRRMTLPFFIYEGEQFVGEIMLYAFRGRRCAELSVRLLPAYGGRGLASDAVRTLTAFAQEELALSTLYIDVHRDNTAACRLFTHLFGQGHRREDVYHFCVTL